MNAGASAKEYGIFLPVGNGGWIMSETAPHPRATYADNREITLVAERLGLDFVMSMAKWRGYGGRTDHWGQTLESLTTTSALAEATERIALWTTVHTNLFHPALVAKMLATLDQVSDGRCGVNLVVGAYEHEFSQMGQWRADFSHDDRYRYTEEWLEVLERLWTQDSVTHHGEFFTLDDCQSRPHPARRPRVISAGRSPAGLRFQAAHCDGSFLTAADLPGLRVANDEVKAHAAEHGRTIRTYAMLTVVLGASDAAARETFLEYGRGYDAEAVTNMKLSWGLPLERAMSMTAGDEAHEAFQTAVVVGGAESVTEQVLAHVEDTGLDGVMLIFPDYLRDLPVFGERVLPALRAASGTTP
ncbi:LLM class flavin-dependent oxidoreductase [Kineococcus rhizosphaerae]|uniref:Pyrimidine oxygenase n=1 Tax=Kineococcus rhizosphaerae TaxID=559628 RepID=A0A2T0R9H4_9ACTN|nr:LLM class flavin-dependent oxidoreductase [Kineococcus rhizosphaerae]PRY17815.1 pyrimidine oxygenase [Kineococcus rhizosphaerae]